MEMEVTQEQYEQLKEIALQQDITIEQAFEYVLILGMLIKNAGLEEQVNRDYKDLKRWRETFKEETQ